MNYDSYPTANNPETQPSNAELEYRQKLTSKILAESIGRVGVYTTTDLNSEQTLSLNQKIAERNPRGADNQVIVGRGGWGDWGERKIDTPLDGVPNRNLLAPATTQRENDEETAFVAMPDGTVEVRYYFHTAQGYRDGAGRPGNSLNVAFTLSPEKAAELDSAIEADPSFMETVIEAQVLSVGMPKEIWNQHLRPRIGFNLLTGVKDHALAVTHASADGRQTTTLRPYADKQPILPEIEPPIDTPSAPESEPAYSFEERYDAISRGVNPIVQQEKNRNTPLSEIIKSFQEPLTEAYDDLKTAERGSEDHTYYAALAAVYAEIIDTLERELAQQTATEQQQRDIIDAQSEIDQAFVATPNETLESATTDTPQYIVGTTVQYKDSAHSIVNSYALGNGKQMLVLKNSLGHEEHVTAAKLSRQ